MVDPEVKKTFFKFGGTREKTPKLISVIGDEDTCVGLLLAGIGEVDKNRTPNFFVVNKLTEKTHIEDAFKRLVRNPEVDVILINKFVADMIRNVVSAHLSGQPALLEIPSRDHPYDPDKDVVLKRAKTHFYSEENA